jgi:hypothetical protein
MVHANLEMNVASNTVMVTSAISLASLPRRPLVSATISRKMANANMELTADFLTIPQIVLIRGDI